MTSLLSNLIRLAHGNKNLRSHILTLVKKARATPLPVFKDTEIGLMTREEFLAYRNPQNKFHGSTTFDTTVSDLNNTLSNLALVRTRDNEFSVKQSDHGLVLFLDENPVAVIHQGTLYHTPKSNPRDIPRGYPNRVNGDWIDFGIKGTKIVKYLTEALSLVNRVADKNLKEYPHILQRVLVKGKPFTIRSEAPPVEDNGKTIVAMNELGEVVAMASDEWGATLLRVADEYRGMGLGKIVGRFWYEWNPGYESGGFTQAGANNAVKLWESRVRDFLSNGWYTDLVRTGKLNPDRVREILSGLGDRPKPDRSEPKNPEVKSQTLVYAEDEAFVLYDAKFLQEPDEKYLHGYGFFRDSDPVGTFLYRIDYDPAYRKQTTLVALQMAKDSGYKLYIGPDYGDLVELDGIPQAEVEGNYVTLTKDVLPLKDLSRLEKAIRTKNDPYREISSQLLELSESKW